MRETHVVTLSQERATKRVASTVESGKALRLLDRLERKRVSDEPPVDPFTSRAAPLRCSAPPRARPELLHSVPARASHPVRQHAEDACIQFSVIVPLRQRPLQILGGEFEDVVGENEKGDEIEQETCRRD